MAINKLRRVEKYSSNHRLAHSSKKVLEYYLILESVIPGVFDPKKGHCIHHVDGDITNNLNTNLVVCQDKAYHNLLHKRQRAHAACGFAHYLTCAFCKQYDDPKNMSLSRGKNSTSDRGIHRSCHTEYEKNRKLRRLTLDAEALLLLDRV
jgi:hypothetical protein